MWLLLYRHAEPRENTEIFFWYNHVLYVLSRLDETGQTVFELFLAPAYCGGIRCDATLVFRYGHIGKRHRRNQSE